MYIAVCDDQTEELKDLTELLGAWETDRGTPVRVKSFRSAAALLDAADRGVKVRIVVDGLVGRLNFLGGDLGYALGTHENIEIRFYNPVNLLAPWGLSARSHEKYVIADGRAFLLGLSLMPI